MTVNVKVSQQCSACEKMRELVRENRIDIDILQHLESDGAITLYGGTCKLYELPKFMEEKKHKSAQLIYYCVKCNQFYNIMIEENGESSIEQITDEKADRLLEELKWGYVGIVFGRWASIDVVIDRDTMNMMDNYSDTRLEVTMNYYDSWIKLVLVLLEDEYLPPSTSDDAVWVLEDDDYNEIFSYSTADGMVEKLTELNQLGDICAKSDHFHLSYYSSLRNRQNYVTKSFR